MSDIVIALLIAIANILGAGMVLPQVLRLRHRSPIGVSGAWVGVGITMNAWWLAYGLQSSLWGLLPVSSVAGVLYGVIAWQLLAAGSPTATRELAMGALGLGLIPVPFLLAGGWSAAGSAIGLCYGLQFAPAALAAVRADEVTGISPTTWSMALLEAMIWLLYGTSIGDRALTVGGLSGSAMAALILLRLLRTSSTSPTPRTTDPLGTPGRPWSPSAATRRPTAIRATGNR